MTNEKNGTPLRVTDWENDASQGMALASKTISDDHIENVTRLRDRQAAYLASLQMEPGDVSSAVLKSLLCPADVGEPHYAARAALEIIHQLTTHSALDDSPQMKDALYWLSIQGLDAMASIENSIQVSIDILQANESCDVAEVTS